MASPFSDRLWIVRRRALAFAAAFFVASGLCATLACYVNDPKEDPGPVVYLFPVAIAVILGTFPTLAYFLNRWIRQFQVEHCPSCGAFIWPTTIDAIQVAVLPRCQRCWKPLAEAADEN